MVVARYTHGQLVIIDRLREMVVEGSRRARVVAQATMSRVRDAVRLKY